MPELTLYKEYSRKEARDLLDPTADYTPGAGTWGISGIINIQSDYKHFVFFVTYGQKQSGHIFDEGITKEGILQWQSQPSQTLRDKRVSHWINQKNNGCRISLLVRNSKNKPYIYAGDLSYVRHAKNTERPVWFSFQLINWRYLPQLHSEINPIKQQPRSEQSSPNHRHRTYVVSEQEMQDGTLPKSVLKQQEEPIGGALTWESKQLKDLIDIHPEILGVEEGKELDFDYETTLGSVIPLLIHAPGKEKFVVGFSDCNHDGDLFRELGRVIGYSVELAMELGETIGSHNIKVVLFIKSGEFPVTRGTAKKHNVLLVDI